MTGGEHVSDLLSAYALDCLDEGELTAVSEHVATCSACRAELSRYLGVVAQMGLASPDKTPPPQLRQRLMARVQPTAPAQPATAYRSWRHWLNGAVQRASPAWGLVSIALVLMLVVANVLSWQQLARYRAAPAQAGVTIVHLVGTDASPAANGIIAMSSSGEYGTLVVQGLPQLDAQRQYQLWLIRDGQRTSGSVFSVNPDGYSATLISSATSLFSYSAFGITVEPAGGSPQPTGARVLGSAL